MEHGIGEIYQQDSAGLRSLSLIVLVTAGEVARISYAEDDMPIETVINVFPSQQWRLSYEWPAG